MSEENKETKINVSLIPFGGLTTLIILLVKEDDLLTAIINYINRL